MSPEPVVEPHCPADGSRLIRRTFESIEVDVCPQCGGIWFDRSELDDIMRSALTRPREAKLLDPRAGQARPPPDHPAPRACPRCSGSHMIAEKYAGVSGVDLDRCPRCGGIWADGGELGALVEFLHGPQPIHSARALGEAIARSVKERERTKEMAQLGRTLGQRVPLYWLYLPKIILPLGTTVAKQRLPLVTLGLVVVNVLIYILQFLVMSDPATIVNDLGLVPARVLRGEGIHGLFTSMFVHAGILHLLGNLLYLWIFSWPLEDELGHGRFLRNYVLFGLAASVAFLLARPGADIPAVGASGAISGVMGAYLVRFPASRIKTFIIMRTFHIPAWLYLGLWIGLQLLALAASGGGCSGVAVSAHVGGFFAGVATATWRKRKTRPPPPGRLA